MRASEPLPVTTLARVKLPLTLMLSAPLNVMLLVPLKLLVPLVFNVALVKLMAFVILVSNVPLIVRVVPANTFTVLSPSVDASLEMLNVPASTFVVPP